MLVTYFYLIYKRLRQIFYFKFVLSKIVDISTNSREPYGVSLALKRTDDVTYAKVTPHDTKFM